MVGLDGYIMFVYLQRYIYSTKGNKIIAIPAATAIAVDWPSAALSKLRMTIGTRGATGTGSGIGPAIGVSYEVGAFGGT